MKKILIIAVVLLVSNLVYSQHEHHVPRTQKDTIPTKKMPQVESAHQHQHGDHSSNGMKMPTHAYSLNLPMNRNGSGTGWNPDVSPMYMRLKRSGKTDWMFHGNIFLRYTHTNVFNDDKRGEGDWSFPNWFMAMMNRKSGKRGLLNFTAMVSLDRLTDGGNGYPLLVQSGETWQGQPLVDRQHPHDLFSALSVGYTHMLSKDMDIFGYFGYPGEPAIGAPAFMHRVSSMNNPDAPLGHHWQDATHITFGVGTLGFRYKQFKVEGSIFTGREPDENRFDFDKARFDSYSYRLSYNPGKDWALQFSQGFIKEPEVLEPGVDVTRTTASALFTHVISKTNHFSGAAIWGLNDKGEDHTEHSILVEGNYQVNKNAIFSRYEFVQKSSEEIGLENDLGPSKENVHAFSLGYNRIIWKNAAIDFVAGAKATLNVPSEALKTYYGNVPFGLQVYFQLRPSIHAH
jgi:hypothetical protein